MTLLLGVSMIDSCLVIVSVAVVFDLLIADIYTPRGKSECLSMCTSVDGSKTSLQ